MGDEALRIVDRQRCRHVEEGKVADLVATAQRGDGVARSQSSVASGDNSIEGVLFGDEVGGDGSNGRLFHVGSMACPRCGGRREVSPLCRGRVDGQVIDARAAAMWVSISSRVSWRKALIVPA